MSSSGFSTPQGGLPRQSSTGNVSPNSAPPLPPRTRRGTEYSHTPTHRPITAGYSLDSGSSISDEQQVNGLQNRSGNYTNHPPPPVPSRTHNSTARQLQYETPPVPRPKSHTVSTPSHSVTLQGSGTYTTIEGNRPPLNRNQPSVDYGNLDDQDWYWGNVPKEEVTEIMKDKSDGSFLIRDAARIPGSYTLTLRKDGVNRLIRIMFREGYYGFAEPLEFRSVIELVEFYSRNSLQPYSHKLDITLQEPVSRLNAYIVENEGAMGTIEERSPEYAAKKIKEADEQLRGMNGDYNDLSERFAKTANDIQVMRLELAAQEQLILILKEHLAICEKNQSEESVEIRQGLIRNLNQLKRRYSTQEHSHKELEAKLHRTEQQKNQLDIERNKLKPIIKELQQEKLKNLRFLEKKGLSPSDVLQDTVDEEDNLEDDLYATYAMLHTYRQYASDYQRISEQIQKKKRKPPPPPPVQQVQVPGGLISHHQLQLPQNLPHFVETSWMRPQISREESRDLLQGRPNGTFLVRPKPDVVDQVPLQDPLHTHTIDIMDDGKFKRIPVFRGPEGGYGFAHPYEFDSLFSLVCYYATNTMQRHNVSLQNTSLLHPAFLQH